MVSVSKITSSFGAGNVKKALKKVVSSPISQASQEAAKVAIPAGIGAAAFGVLISNDKKKNQKDQGVQYDKDSKNLQFNVASKNASLIKLYLFSEPTYGHVIKSVDMVKDGDNWSYTFDKKAQDELNLSIEDKKPIYYGYRAWGPNWQYDKKWMPGLSTGFISHVDSQGNRFNPNKLLFDPYSREISHDPISPHMQGLIYDEIYSTGEDNYRKDTGAIAPKSVFVLQDEEVSTGEKPKRNIKDDIIYEVHLRGFSKLDEKIPEQYRGTYKGAAMKAKYLKEMGITMVEFLPLQEFDDDKNDYNLGRKNNYWGYETVNFFSPNKRYAYDKSPGGAIKEFKEMVKAFHDEGIKVCMDVVYNHTAEGGIKKGDNDVASVFSLRGLDNSSYYSTASDGKAFCDKSGCGADINSANPLGTNLIISSLKYWANEMGIDAFRFDLAPILANNKENGGFFFDANSELMKRINSELDVRQNNSETGSVDLIAEPWACGEETYQTGKFPSNFREWNDNFRNVIRSLFNRQEKTSFSDIARVISGSDDLFKGQNTRSVNYISSHDGFTLKDLFSYNSPFNKNPEFFSDGGTQGAANISWDNNGNLSQQLKAMKNAFLTLFISKGTPMILGGDEVIRTQLGNNNAYCLDNEKNYINWNIDEKQKDMQEFVSRAAKFRASHPALRESKFFDGKTNSKSGLKDVTWLMPDGREAKGEYFDNPENGFLGLRLDESSYSGASSSVFVGINKGDSNIDITLPPNMKGKKWYLVADTAESSLIEHNFAKEGEEVCINGSKFSSKPRSTLLFIEK